MEMTIDEAMANLSMYSVDEYGNAYASTWYKGIAEDMENSFELAIDIMRKYQKIEQLIADYEEYKWERGVVCKREITVKDIREVIEDGNVD